MYDGRWSFFFVVSFKSNKRSDLFSHVSHLRNVTLEGRSFYLYLYQVSCGPFIFLFFSLNSWWSDFSLRFFLVLTWTSVWSCMSFFLCIRCHGAPFNNCIIKLVITSPSSLTSQTCRRSLFTPAIYVIHVHGLYRNLSEKAETVTTSSVVFFSLNVDCN